MWLKKENWVPQGVADLEPAADRAVRTNDVNLAVVAGPGAGKTELLAQKACYLLQTNECCYPQRILAISFKRDAAKNLRDRVNKRCGAGLAGRFDSYTFDAFSKGLLDRFLPAIPYTLRPTVDYEVSFGLQRTAGVQDLFQQLVSRGGLTQQDIYSLPEQNFEKEVLCRNSLASQEMREDSVWARAAWEAWKYLVCDQRPSQLTFGMINRLVGWLLEVNPMILKALQATYGFVFLDEFQDTTTLQYQLIRNCFLGADTHITAVGDVKQKIMGWAGAMKHGFGDYEKDFCAERIPLNFNYRSAPQLVAIQRIVASALEKGTSAPPHTIVQQQSGECRLLRFSNVRQEASEIASLVHSYIQNDGVKPRDICILSRNQVEQYTSNLQQQFAHHGVAARVENSMQDILTEPITQLIISSLRVAFGKRTCPEGLQALEFYFSQQLGAEFDTNSTRLETAIGKLLSELRGKNFVDDSGSEIGELLQCILRHLDETFLKSMYPQYCQGTLLEQKLQEIKDHLTNYTDSASWDELLDQFEGLHTVPIMTIHKSKGLEYHTVIFIGLEDASLWGFDRNPEEETCTFFVALSRAKQRVVFTFSETRPDRWGRNTRQSNAKLGPIYDLLEQAGIVPESSG